MARSNGCARYMNRIHHLTLHFLFTHFRKKNNYQSHFPSVSFQNLSTLMIIIYFLQHEFRLSSSVHSIRAPGRRSVAREIIPRESRERFFFRCLSTTSCYSFCSKQFSFFFWFLSSYQNELLSFERDERISATGWNISWRKYRLALFRLTFIHR